MRSTPPNQFRWRGLQAGRWASTDADGMNGAFSLPLKGLGHKVLANCIVSDGVNVPPEMPQEWKGWEHVSVHIFEYGKSRTPFWREMCIIKEVFWEDEEEVVQFHPKKSQYVNVHPHVLHLWRKKDGFPTPPKIMV